MRKPKNYCRSAAGGRNCVKSAILNLKKRVHLTGPPFLSKLSSLP